MTAGVLLLDLGNRKLKVARTQSPGYVDLMSSIRLEDSSKWQDHIAWLVDQVHRFDGAAWLSSTRPALLEELLAVEGIRDKVRVVQPADLPISIASQGTGMDRLLAAVAAWRRAKCDVLVADLGTAWTLDATTADGVFLGGAIGPGIALQENALASACPHLASPSSEPSGGIPQNTADAVAEGIRSSLALALNGLSWAYQKEFSGEPQSFLCGGDAGKLSPWLGPEWQQVEQLVLEGLSFVALEQTC